MGAAANRSHPSFEVASRAPLAKSFRNQPCLFGLSVKDGVSVSNAREFSSLLVNVFCYSPPHSKILRHVTVFKTKMRIYVKFLQLTILLRVDDYTPCISSSFHTFKFHRKISIGAIVTSSATALIFWGILPTPPPSASSSFGRGTSRGISELCNLNPIGKCASRNSPPFCLSFTP